MVRRLKVSIASRARARIIVVQNTRHHRAPIASTLGATTHASKWALARALERPFTRVKLARVEYHRWCVLLICAHAPGDAQRRAALTLVTNPV